MHAFLGYIDPGTGYVLGQGTSFLWGLLIGFLGTFLVFFRVFFSFIKKFFRFIIVIILILIVIIGGSMFFSHRGQNGRRVVIIGFDAMDPRMTEDLMKEGKLPHFAQLMKDGSYAHLATTTPPESVVAWSSFATGLAPADHGIYDFIQRDNKYNLFLSLNETPIVRKKLKVNSFRHGKAFWEILSDARIPSYTYFCPNTFPASPVYGTMLSGMGTPDILGTMGKYSFYTTLPPAANDSQSRGRLIHIANTPTIHCSLYGPKVGSGARVAEATLPMAFTRTDKGSVTIALGKKRVTLGQKQWSPWIEVSFSIGPFQKIRGIVRVYVKSVSPDLELYFTPVNFDPRHPYFPISYPRAHAGKLARKVGSFYTQGMPYDTWALTEGRLDEEAFLQLSEEILGKKEQLMQQALARFDRGVFFFYFEALDVIQHMFWRYTDPSSPLYEEAGAYKKTIADYYQRMDAVLGRVMATIGDGTTLIVLSDHGCGPFRRSVNLNRWLLENGYLALKGDRTESAEFFEQVDWSRTRAYALGFGAIYINKAGREYYGIVKEQEVAHLRTEIMAKLERLTDPLNNARVVSTVYSHDEAFSGAFGDTAPDLYVGFDYGYRASWKTALGAVSGSSLEDNLRKWSGDHLIDPALVPGVFFINKKVHITNPRIDAIVPAVLKMFGLSDPQLNNSVAIFDDEIK